MKKVILGLLSLLTVGGLIAGGIYHADTIKGWFKQKEDKQEEVWEEYVNQFNWTNAPSISVGLDVSGKTPALTFTGTTDNDTAEDVFSSENYSYGILVAPVSDFNTLNTKKVNQFDWKTAFDNSAIEPVVDVELTKDSKYVKIGETKTEFSVSVPIEYGKHNTQYASVMYKKEVNKDGFARYLYADANTGLTGISALYKATQCLSYSIGADLDYGFVQYTDAELQAFNKIVNDAVDYANGLDKPTNDNSQLKFTTNLPSADKDGNVNLTLKQYTAEKYDMEDCFQVKVEIEHDLDVFIRFRAEEPNMFYIYSDGTIDQFNAGEALCMCYVGGQMFEFNLILEQEIVETSDVAE